MKVAVLGGGITGLTLTRLLAEHGHDVHCLEAAPATGGLCASETVDGFVADKSGGHIVFSKDAAVLAYMLEALEPVGHHTSERRTFIYQRGRYIPYPFENGLGELPDEPRFLCLRDYVEAAFERRTGAPEPDNFEDWCRWRFGEEICREFMWPYNRKIWNVDLRELGVRWVSGRVPDAPLDDVLRAALGHSTVGYGHQAVFHYPLEGGFQAMVDGVLARIPAGRVHTATPCRLLERDGSGWSVNGQAYDRVVSTIPMQELAKVLPDVPEAVARAFAGLGWSSLATVFMALDRPEVPARSWVYFPHQENGPQNRITYLSNYSPRNAPDGKTSVMAEVTYVGAPPATDEQITRSVAEGLERCGVIERRQVIFTRVHHSRYAYILYGHGLEERLDTIRAWAESANLDLCGRFGNYDYFNSDQCIRSAMDKAAEIHAFARSG